ncbi:MAG: hypothetical protein KKH94_06510 [Candidatus Omnitrophica bacterium]|nr:hypothetical protein [Candidatus Omnitrophota bacterium]
MKKIILSFIILGLLVFGNGYTQTAKPEEPKTKLEIFEKQTGTVVIKGIGTESSVSGLGSVSVKCIELTNISIDARQRGIAVDVKESGRLDRSNRTFIDYDEIEPLLKGIDYISNITSNPTKLAGFEATYSTKGDLTITVFSGTAGKISAAVTSGYIGRTTAFLSTTQLSQLRSLIAQAKQKLDEIK